MWTRAAQRLRRFVARHVVRPSRYTSLVHQHDVLEVRHEELRHAHADLARRFDDLARRNHQAVMERNHLQKMFVTWVPPGHFYSPYPDRDEVAKRADRIFDTTIQPRGIDLRDEAQLEFFETLADLAEDIPFPAEPGDEFRYYFDNPAYGWSDGIVLYAMLSHIRPHRIVEVGSGYSSALMLDTLDIWPDHDVDLSFVEPYPELLHSLMRPGDEQRVTLHPEPVQDLPMDVFTSLQAGDVLFIDSTHVVKAGGDVNHLYFDVLPQLAEGVWIHIHDVFFPFEYPWDWVVDEGRAWQEVYLLRALLMDNPRFEIRWFQHYMWAHHRQLLEDRLPLMAKNAGGNIWLQRTGT